MRIYVVLAMTLSIGLLNAVTHSVNIDGTGQFASIQSAINASANGDIILVYPGRYFENVDYNGKQITVQSLEATTSDTTYIRTTIIDGNNSGSCVRFHNSEQNATLRGFTLTHGIGSQIWEDEERLGGAIQLWINISVSIINCEITDNRASRGAGIFMYKSTAFFSGLKIHHNYGTSHGAGISIQSFTNYTPNIVFDTVNRCSVYDNYGTNPCDIMIIDVMQNIDIYLDLFTVANPDNFYIDRYSNFIATEPYADNLYYQRVYREEINHDLYVSPDGDDDHSGLSADEALKTITVAMHRVAADSLDRKTVHILPGKYDEGDGQQIFPIPLKSNVNLVGAGSGQVELYTDIVNDNITGEFFGSWRQRNMSLSGFSIRAAQNSYRRPFVSLATITNFYLNDIVMDSLLTVRQGTVFISSAYNTHITGLVMRSITTQGIIFGIGERWVSGSMKNCVFENIHSINNDPNTLDVAMFDFWVGDSLTVENCKFRNFSAVNDQLPIHISNTNMSHINTPVHINIKNCFFENIRTNTTFYAIGFNNYNVDDYKVSNCTFTNNYAQGGVVGLCGKVQMKNNIFYNRDVIHEIKMDITSPYGFNSNINFDYNNIRNGQSGIYNPYSNNILVYGTHNNSDNPLFADDSPRDPNYLYLLAGSPCIDSGTPDTTGLFLPIMDIAGNYRIWNNRIDMGCYEYESMPVGNEQQVQNTPEAGVITNYPNPFNPSTTISYSLKENAPVSLNIYNIRGQLVKSLVNEEQKSGNHTVVWNGYDDSGNTCASGVYFSRLDAGKASLTKKMVLLK